MLNKKLYGFALLCLVCFLCAAAVLFAQSESEGDVEVISKSKVIMPPVRQGGTVSDAPVIKIEKRKVETRREKEAELRRLREEKRRLEDELRRTEKEIRRLEDELH